MKLRPLLPYLGLFATAALAADTTPFGMAELQKLIESKDIRSIEALLPALPKELRDNFVLMRHSGSVQAATPENPRAILFGNTGKLVLSFTGNDSMRGGKNIEILELDESSSHPHFVVHEIQFAGNGARPHFSDSNDAKKCQQCHGDPIKPLWGSYNSVQGAYGPAVSEMKKDSPDRDPFLSFKKTALTHPRYGHLAWDPKNEYSPFVGEDTEPKLSALPNSRFSVLMSVNLAKQQADRAAESSLFKRYPFTVAATQFCFLPDDTASAFYKVMKSQGSAPNQSRAKSDYSDDEGNYSEEPTFFHPIPGDKERAAAFFPSEIRTALGLRKDDLTLEIPNNTEHIVNESGIFQTTKDLFFQQLVAKALELKPSGQVQQELIKARDDVAFKVARLDVVGPDNTVPFKNFFNVPELANYLEKTGIVYAFHLEVGDEKRKDICKPLLKLAVQEMSAVASALASASDCDSTTSHAPLAPQTRAEVKTLQSTLQNHIAERGTAILNKAGCISCHDPSGPFKIGPPIPYSDPSKLRQALWVKNDSGKPLIDRIRERISPQFPIEKRMPLGREKLSDDDRSALEEYLESLK
ncbi:MAG: c-type cytochrome [Bdellovibrionia bacterium]